MGQSRSGIGFAQRAQQVQRHDVARTFPDAVERHLAVDARHHAFAALFHIAVAAQAFHGFLRKMAAALADPELGNGREQAVHHLLMGIARVVKTARQTQRQRGGRFGLQRQIGQHVVHQRLIDQQLAKGLALRRVVQRQRQRLAHQPAGAQRAVQPRHVAHGQNLRHAAPFFAHQPGGGAHELHFGAGIGLVAQLVFQALNEQRFIEPSGNTRGRNRQLKPEAVCARIRKASHMGAEKNHLCPVTR